MTAGFDTLEVDWSAIATTSLNEALTQALPDDNESVKRSVVCGHPAVALLAAAEGAELLAVGSRGHGGFTGMLLGSVSAHLVAHAPCPVVVVRHLTDPVDTFHNPPTSGGLAMSTTLAPIAPGTYADADLELDLRWWAAANYLTVAQIYLQDNALMRDPLTVEHIKPRLLGHWGTSQVCALLSSQGWGPVMVAGDDPAIVFPQLYAALAHAHRQITALQHEARTSPDAVPGPARWPAIVLRTPKGWTGPDIVDESRSKAPSAPTKYLSPRCGKTPNTCGCSGSGCAPTTPTSSSTPMAP